jgi:hypothetical protein
MRLAADDILVKEGCDRVLQWLAHDGVGLKKMNVLMRPGVNGVIEAAMLEFDLNDPPKRNSVLRIPPCYSSPTSSFVLPCRLYIKHGSVLKSRRVHALHEAQNRADGIKDETSFRLMQKVVVVSETLVVAHLIELVEDADGVL